MSPPPVDLANSPTFRGALGLLAVCVLACAPPPPEATHPAPLAPQEVEARIERSEKFGEPLHLEVWPVGRGATIQALVQLGLAEPLATDRPSIALTSRAREAGAHETGFQDDFPIFRLPVGRRQFGSIVRSQQVLEGRGLIVDFDYQSVTTDLGRAMRDAGATVDGIESSYRRRGRAIFGREGSEWKLDLLEL